MLKIYSEISPGRIIYYILTSLLYYLAFIFGSHRGESKKRLYRRVSLLTPKSNFNFSQKLAYPLVFIMMVGILYVNRDSLLRGYVYLFTLSSYSSKRVLLSVFELILLAYVLYFLNSNTHEKIRKKVINKWTLLLAAYSLLLLTTGGRMYVVTSILAIVIFISYSQSNNFNIFRVIFYAVLFAIMFGMLGIFRFGFEDFDFSLAIFNIIEEPLYTNYSNLTYLQNYSPFNIACFPKIFLSGIVNLLPTLLFPWKLEIITNITDLYPKIEQPLGATHFYPSYNAGIGFLFSIALFYIIGKLLGSIYSNFKESKAYLGVSYCMVSANLAFSLFRDPISTSLFKNIFEFSVCLPFIIALINDLCYVAHTHGTNIKKE